LIRSDHAKLLHVMLISDSKICCYVDFLKVPQIWQRNASQDEIEIGFTSSVNVLVFQKFQ